MLTKIQKTRKQSYLYGLTDDKYVPPKIKTPVKLGPGYKFKIIPELEGRLCLPKNKPSIRLNLQPETLVMIAGKVVDSIPMLEPFNWSNAQVCHWISSIGFPQYKNTFRVNLINGRTLLLLEASQLVSMNISIFEHIQAITSAIRRLHKYEYAFFNRRKSEPAKPLDSLNKDFHIRTALSPEYQFREIEKYAITRPTELYRYMNIIPPLPKNNDHWNTLKDKLTHNYKLGEISAKTMPTDPNSYQELYKDHYPSVLGKNYKKQERKSMMDVCHCMPPCECKWTEDDRRAPGVIKSLNRSPKKIPIAGKCQCTPPCSCNWKPSELETKPALSILIVNNPQKYNISISHDIIDDLKSRFRARSLSQRSSFQYRSSISRKWSTAMKTSNE